MRTRRPTANPARLLAVVDVLERVPNELERLVVEVGGPIFGEPRESREGAAIWHFSQNPSTLEPVPYADRRSSSNEFGGDRPGES